MLCKTNYNIIEQKNLEIQRKEVRKNDKEDKRFNGIKRGNLPDRKTGR